MDSFSFNEIFLGFADKTIFYFVTIKDSRQNVTSCFVSDLQN